MTRDEDSPMTSVVAEVLAGGGAMGALMRSLDWAATPLGPVESWPQSLRTSVSICLTSRFPMLIWWGPELVMLYNDAYRPILGTTKHPTSMGQRGRDCWPEIWDIIGPMLAGVRATGEATWSDDQLLLLDRNGYVEECYFTFSYSPIRDESGGVGGVFTAVTETTSRVLGERCLRVLRELADRTAGTKTAADACALAAAALGGNPAAIPFALLYLLDPDGRTAHLAGMTGLDAGVALIPRHVDLAEAADAAEGWPLARVARTGQAALMDDGAARFGPLPAHAGASAPSSALVLPVAQAGQDGVAGFLVAGVNPFRALDDDYRGFYDLVAGQIATAIADARAYDEERKRAEALAALDHAKTTFFSNISHELRTPLTLMLGPIEDALADRADALAPSQRERLDIAHRNSLRLLKLVNTLLDFSRIEAGSARAAYEQVDLAAYTVELASGFRAAVERAGLRLLVDCAALPAPAYVDRDMWEKIVLNLLSNAIKFTFEGEIAVTLRQVGAGVELEVRDTGTGIPAAELPHLFERFHRVRGAWARTHEGTGIGLALVQELARLHGGTVRVSSAVGTGTTFTVALPLGAAHLPADRVVGASTERPMAPGAPPYAAEALRWLPDTLDTSGAPPGDGAPYRAGDPASPSLDADGEQDGVVAEPPARILLADDNADMRAYLARLLGARYDVRTAVDGEAALEAALAWAPDLVLSDVMMPRLDGIGLLRALRDAPQTRATPVILLSARAGEDAAVEGLDAGADDYLVKPFAARELLARVRTHVELARLRARMVEDRAHLLAQATAARMEATARARELGVTIEAMVDGVAIYDTDGRVQQVNAALRALMGWDADPAVATLTLAERAARQSIRDEDGQLIPVDALPPLRAARGDVLTGARAVDMRIHTIDGRMIQLSTSAAPVRDEDGRIVGAVAVYHDVTERRRLERAAAVERRQLHDLFMQAPAMIALLAGSDHVFEVANAWYQRGSGRSGADLIGRSIRAAFPELAGQGYYELLDEVYRTGRPFVGAEIPMRLDRTGDGRLEDVYFTFTYQPIAGVDGVVESIMVLAVDVTEQVRARRQVESLATELGAERDRLRQVLDVLPAGVVIADVAGQFTVSNEAAAAIFGPGLPGRPVSQGEYEAYDTYGCRRPDGAPYPSDELPLQRAMWRGEMVRGEQFLTRAAATGQDMTVLANAAPLCGPDGAIVGAVGVFQDITVIKDLERAREEFLSSASHDLKAPLTSIRGQAQLAQRRLSRIDTPETAAVARQLALIDAGTGRMLALINELVDVTRADLGGGLDLDRRAVDLVALARGVVAQQTDLTTHRIVVDTALPALEAAVDVARIERVVTNLVSNAVKYSPDGGDITVTVAREDDMAVIAVSDHGLGIPADDAPRVFERFHRAANVAGRIAGTGIGLASARQIVERHGGRIAVESAEGVGSTFTIRLPIEGI